MCHILKNGSVRKMGHNWKNVEQLEKCVTLKKRVTVRKMCHNKKNASPLERCVPFRKMCQNGSVRKMRPIKKNLLQLEK